VPGTGIRPRSSGAANGPHGERGAASDATPWVALELALAALYDAHGAPGSKNGDTQDK
jgi:hypothetical protein